MSEAIPHGKIFRPGEINLAGEWLTWKLPGMTSQANWVRCTDTTLVQFTKLKQASDVLRFARRYGVFGAKEMIEDAPQMPNELRLSPGAGRWCVSIKATMEDKEPLWIWFLLSRQARAILRVNAGLKGRTHNPMPEVGTGDDWKAIAGPGEPFTDVRDAQFFLMLAVNEWLRIGEVGLRLELVGISRTKTDWRVGVGYGQLYGYNLFGHLAYRLLLSVAGEDRLYACSACGNPYIRIKRAPRAGQDNYCDDCAHVARLRATQRYRQNNKRGLSSRIRM
jgi:hypothetical protein